MIFKIYNRDLLSVRKKVCGSLREFVGVFEQFFNAQNEHFFTKKKEIHKTPANSRKIWWEFAGVCGSFSYIFKCTKRTFFHKKTEIHKTPTNSPGLSTPTLFIRRSLNNSERDYQLPPLIMPAQKLPHKNSFFLTKKFIFRT